MHLFMACGISGKTGHFCQRQCVCNLRRYSRLTSYPLPDPPFPPLFHNGVKLNLKFLVHKFDHVRLYDIFLRYFGMMLPDFGMKIYYDFSQFFVKFIFWKIET